MKLWNLIEGRCAFTRSLRGATGEQVLFSNSGEAYLLVCGKICSIMSTSENAILCELVMPSRINRALFVPSLAKIVQNTTSDQISDKEKESLVARSTTSCVLILCEDKTISLYSVTGEKISSITLPNEVSDRMIFLIYNICVCFFFNP